MKVQGPKTFDPREAIRYRIEFLSSRSSPCVANMETIQFLKAHAIAMHQLHSVAFEDVMKLAWRFIYFLNQHEDGSWYVKSSTGDREPVQPLPQDGQPGVQLQWGWYKLPTVGGTANEFYAGGEVIDAGFDIVQVRLVSSNGLILEDLVQDGLVLFWSDQEVALLVQAELYNRSGDLVITQPSLALPSLSQLQFGGTFRPTF